MTMIIVNTEQVQHLRSLLPAITKEHLQGTLGISETTWVRLRDRRPIRRSTYERLMRRSGLSRPSCAGQERGSSVVPPMIHAQPSAPGGAFHDAG
ncbi:hypothetical protein [Caulobacter sp. RL271]|jgi:hypothetical protein|uniref:Transcriptional regulator n=1 Tax=Caulobacter segnis TaxID=88688 RepID=A0ABY5A336_9CAUL|nr:hypothetical protein [Caulobacter segnis]USQ98667.1 hypothetical protein MZV50_03010 [Caulobacter segnis]